MLRSLLTVFVLCLSTISLVACDLYQKTSPVEAKVHIRVPPESMSYFKDSFGICYAKLESRTYYDYKVHSLAAVPCEKVGL